MLIKPKKLKRGDTVAIVSLSSGLAGEESIAWRTRQGIQRLEEVFGLKVKVMPHALKGIDYIYNHPEKWSQTARSFRNGSDGCGRFYIYRLRRRG